MPKTKKFQKLLKSTIKQYGKSRGTKIAYAIAKKRGYKT